MTRSEPDETADDGLDVESASDGAPDGGQAAAEPDPAGEVQPTTDIAPLLDGPGAQVDRLTDVLLAADQAAAEILDAARAEANDFVAETQRSTVERAESLRRETDNLMAQTAELTAKVVELTRATEQVMEGFRAELSLEAPEVREETLTPALPQPTPVPEPVDEPVPAPAPIEDVAPEDTSLAPEPVIDEASASEESAAEAAAEPALEEPQLVEEPAADEGPVASSDEPAVAAAPATTEITSVEPETAGEDTSATPDSSIPGPPPAPAAAPEPAAEPKRRGLFGRLRGRGKEQPASEPAPEPTPAPAVTQESPAPNARTGPVTEGARLIARQMLATGLGEEEVKRQLREQFRLADPQAVLDSLRRNDRDDQSG